MRYVDEYRAPEAGDAADRAPLNVPPRRYTAERPLRIMEVCGGHTHAIFKFGLDQLLPEIEFIHGPGCPVCVLPMGRIDSCIEIASQPDVIFCTFGDAMRVPGKTARCCRRKRAARISGSSIRRWMP
jgi:hydrogenase expression/formation protein HypD